MKQPHKHAECIKAWADGEVIETYMKSDGEWQVKDKPLWLEHRMYRVKPTPVVTKRYSFYDRIEGYVANGQDLNQMAPQYWYEAPDVKGGMLEWTFTDGKLTSVTITEEK